MTVVIRERRHGCSIGCTIMHNQNIKETWRNVLPLLNAGPRETERLREWMSQMSLSNVSTCCRHAFTDGVQGSIISWLTPKDNGGKSTYLFRIYRSFCRIHATACCYSLLDFYGKVSFSTLHSKSKLGSISMQSLRCVINSNIATEEDI